MKVVLTKSQYQYIISQYKFTERRETTVFDIIRSHIITRYSASDYQSDTDYGAITFDCEEKLNWFLLHI